MRAGDGGDGDGERQRHKKRARQWLFVCMGGSSGVGSEVVGGVGEQRRVEAG